MNYFRVESALIAGIQAVPVRVECAQSRRLPYLQILGGSGGAAGELRERVIAALGTLEGGKFRLPARRFTVQIVPGARSLALEPLDLAVAVALLGSAGLVPAARLEGLLVCGRLGLDGSIGNVAPPAALRRLLEESGCASALLPWEGSEALKPEQLGSGGGFRCLAELVEFLRGGSGRGARARAATGEEEAPAPSRIWTKIAGQEMGKRVIEVSAAGAHHVLFPGPIGARADLLAHALSALLPPLGFREAEEVRGIYALAGMGHVLPSRPFHAFGSRPGLPTLLEDRSLRSVEEILLSHQGVLYLDQACEREGKVFPALLQPMLSGSLPARLRDRPAFVPAETIVVAATPACECGAIGDPRLTCVCRPTEAKRFASRWRRLLRYPFDLCLRLTPERARPGGASLGECAARVEAARSRMRERQGKWNSRLTESELFEGLAWSAGALRLWGALEGRAPGQRREYLAVARVAATLSDLRAGTEVSEADLLEALHYFPAGDAAAAPGSAASASVPEMNSMAMP